MNQPIKPGKLINDHYLVKLILGQGRFNRTYLVEDTHRFNEPCVVKEFAPQIEDLGFTLRKKKLICEI